MAVPNSFYDNNEYTRLSDGQYVRTSTYTSLSAADQKLLTDFGPTIYNAVKQQYNEPQIVSLERLPEKAAVSPPMSPSVQAYIQSQEQHPITTVASDIIKEIETLGQAPTYTFDRPQFLATARQIEGPVPYEAYIPTVGDWFTTVVPEAYKIAGKEKETPEVFQLSAKLGEMQTAARQQIYRESYPEMKTGVSLPELVSQPSYLKAMGTTGLAANFPIAAALYPSVGAKAITPESVGFTALNVASLALPFVKIPPLERVITAKPMETPIMPEGWYVRGAAAREPIVLTDTGFLTSGDLKLLQQGYQPAQISAGPQFKEISAAPIYKQLPAPKEVISFEDFTKGGGSFRPEDITTRGPTEYGEGGTSVKLQPSKTRIAVAEKEDIIAPEWLENLVRDVETKKEIEKLTKPFEIEEKGKPAEITKEKIPVEEKELETRLSPEYLDTGLSEETGLRIPSISIVPEKVSIVSKEEEKRISEKEKKPLTSEEEKKKTEVKEEQLPITVKELFPSTVKKEEAKISKETAAEEEAEAKTEVQPEFQLFPRMITKTQVAPLTEIALKPKTMIKMETKPATKTKAQVEIKPATKTKTQAKTETVTEKIVRTPLKDETVKRVGLFPPVGKLTGEDIIAGKLPKGTIVWKQGKYWKAIYPPYDQDKPLTLKNKPAGAIERKGRGSAYATAQVLKGTVNKIIYVDLGNQDIKITAKGKKAKLEFASGGQHTNVGKSNKSNTLGMGFNDSGEFGKGKYRRLMKHVY